MKLLPKILLSTLLPLVLLVGVYVVQVGDLLTRLNNTIQEGLIVKKDAIIKSFDEKLAQSRQLASILANTQVIASSLEINDSEELYQQGRLFIETGVDYISFVNVRGNVVARGHNESRFGDSFSTNPLIRAALSQQPNSLITNFDKHTYLVSLAPVLKYNEDCLDAFSTATVAVEDASAIPKSSECMKHTSKRLPQWSYFTTAFGFAPQYISGPAITVSPGMNFLPINSTPYGALSFQISIPSISVAS